MRPYVAPALRKVRPLPILATTPPGVSSCVPPRGAPRLAANIVLVVLTLMEMTSIAHAGRSKDDRTVVRAGDRRVRRTRRLLAGTARCRRVAARGPRLAEARQFVARPDMRRTTGKRCADRVPASGRRPKTNWRMRVSTAAPRHSSPNSGRSGLALAPAANAEPVRWTSPCRKRPGGGQRRPLDGQIRRGRRRRLSECLPLPATGFGRTWGTGGAGCASRANRHCESVSRVSDPGAGSRRLGLVERRIRPAPRIVEPARPVAPRQLLPALQLVCGRGVPVKLALPRRLLATRSSDAAVSSPFALPELSRTQ